MRLFGYWRSSATYRVRIILALKGLDYDNVPVNLLEGDQASADYLARNPQALVPSLETDEGAVITQSLAIAEYLEERYPDTPVLPDDLAARAKARAIANIIACEAQPFMNLRVQNYLKRELDLGGEGVAAWLDKWAGGAMAAAEALLADSAGEFCVGDAPSIADAFLVPQLYAARRFGVDLEPLPRMRAIAEHCDSLAPFRRAHPDNQPDAPKS